MTNKFYYFSDLLKNKSLGDVLSDFRNFKSEHANAKFYCLYEADQLKSPNFENCVRNDISMLSDFVDKKDLVIAINHNNDRQVIRQKDLQKLKSLRDSFSDSEIQVGIEDYTYTWSIEQVENSNAQIVDCANQVKSLHMSPFEMLMDVYIRQTNMVYVSEEENESPALSRSVYGVTNGNKIVCVGYSALIQAIINEINIPNIKVFQNQVIVKDTENLTKEGHRNLVVYIKDEKYNLDGYYYLDPTWDSVYRKNKDIRLQYFMLPLSDISKLKGYNILYNRNFTNYVSTDVYKSNGINLKNLKPNSRNISFSKKQIELNDEFYKHIFANQTILNQISTALLDEEISDVTKNREQNFELLKQIQSNYKKSGWKYINKNSRLSKIFYLSNQSVTNLNIQLQRINSEYEKEKPNIVNQVLAEFKKLVKYDTSNKYYKMLAQKLDNEDFKQKVFLYKTNFITVNIQNEINSNFYKLKSEKDVDFIIQSINKTLDSIIVSFDDEFCHNACFWQYTKKEEQEVFDYISNSENIKNYIKRSDFHKLLCETSKPIDYECIKNTLFAVWNKDKEIFGRLNIKKPEQVEHILIQNQKNSKFHFDEGAKNSFYEAASYTYKNPQEEEL